MTREEIDVLWQQAITTSNINGDPAVRYEFANLILESASTILDETSSEYYDGYEFTQVNPSDCAETIRSLKV